MKIVRILYLYRNGHLIRCFNKGRCKAGEIAGTMHKFGYIQVGVCGKHMKAHRVVWWIHYGFIPDNLHIDHSNHIRYDNRIENLSLKSNADNHKNMSIYKNNKSGVHGVYWNSKFSRWDVYIVVNRKKIYVGVFKDFESAKIAKIKAETENNFHRNHGK